MADEVAPRLGDARNIKEVDLQDGTFALAVSLQGGQSGSSPTAVVVEQKSYTTVANGELAGSTNAAQMQDIACKLVKFKASYDNVGRVYIGASGVTVANGSTDTSTGLQLSAGDETGWIPVDNLNRLYRICDNAGDDLTYLLVR